MAPAVPLQPDGGGPYVAQVEALLGQLEAAAQAAELQLHELLAARAAETRRIRLQIGFGYLDDVGGRASQAERDAAIRSGRTPRGAVVRPTVPIRGTPPFAVPTGQPPAGGNTFGPDGEERGDFHPGFS